jgi:aquaporin Z
MASRATGLDYRALGAEFFGTFMLMSSIFGSAFYSFAPPAGAAGILGVAFAIGITVMSMAYAVGPVSGGHFNPAVTLGLVAAGRFEAGRAPSYIIAQCAGSLAAGAVFTVIGHTAPTYAANGYGELSMLKLGLLPVFVIEVVMTAFFLVVITGATSPRASAGFAPIAIGFALAAIHIMSIPVSNTSVNPARSLAPAVFAGGTALSQIWVFWAAPILGGVLGGIIGRWLHQE